MALATYSDLQTALTDWLANTGFSSRTADLIALAEATANREVRVRQSVETATLTLTAGSASVALPSDFLEEIELNYTDTPLSLQRSTYDFIDRTNTSDSIAGRPTQYTFDDANVIFDTEADQNYTLLLRYYKKWDLASTSTNWLLTNHPDVYLFGALAEAAGFQMDDAREAKWAARRDAAIRAALRADSRTRGGELVVDEALLVGGTWR